MTTWYCTWILLNSKHVWSAATFTRVLWTFVQFMSRRWYYHPVTASSRSYLGWTAPTSNPDPQVAPISPIAPTTISVQGINHPLQPLEILIQIVTAVQNNTGQPVNLTGLISKDMTSSIGSIIKMLPFLVRPNNIFNSDPKFDHNWGLHTNQANYVGSRSIYSGKTRIGKIQIWFLRAGTRRRKGEKVPNAYQKWAPEVWAMMQPPTQKTDKTPLFFILILWHWCTNRKSTSEEIEKALMVLVRLNSLFLFLPIVKQEEMPQQESGRTHFLLLEWIGTARSNFHSWDRARMTCSHEDYKLHSSFSQVLAV